MGFQYPYRIPDLAQTVEAELLPGVSPETDAGPMMDVSRRIVALLEDRDRALEDYLNGLKLTSSSLRPATVTIAPHDCINPTQYDIQLPGVDDTAALSAALNSVPAFGSVYIGDGHITVSSRTVLSRPVSVRCAGIDVTFITVKAGANEPTGKLFDNGGGTAGPIGWSHCTIDLNSPNTATSLRAFNLGGAHGVISLHDMKIENWGNVPGIDAGGNDLTLLRDLHFVGTASYSGVTDAAVVTSGSGLYSVDGVRALISDPAAVAFAIRSNTTHVRALRADYVGGGAVTSASFGLEVQFGSDVAIDDAYLSGFGVNVFVNAAADVVARGLMCNGGGNNGGGSEAGSILIDGSSRVRVIGASVHDAKRHGIMATSGAADCTIENSTVHNAGTDAASTYDGIVDANFGGGGGGTNNTIRGCTVRKGANALLNGVEVMAGCTGDVAALNDVRGSYSGTGVADAGTGTKLNYDGSANNWNLT